MGCVWLIARQGRGSEATEAVFWPIGQKKPLHTGLRTGCHFWYLINLSVVYCCVCNVRGFYRFRELYEADFHKPGSYGSGRVYGLTRGTCFVARHLEVVAVAGLLWVSWCVLGGADFFVCACFFSSNGTHTACCKYEAALPHLPLSSAK